MEPLKTKQNIAIYSGSQMRTNTQWCTQKHHHFQNGFFFFLEMSLDTIVNRTSPLHEGARYILQGFLGGGEVLPWGCVCARVFSIRAQHAARRHITGHHDSSLGINLALSVAFWRVIQLYKWCNHTIISQGGWLKSIILVIKARRHKQVKKWRGLQSR